MNSELPFLRDLREKISVAGFDGSWPLLHIEKNEEMEKGDEEESHDGETLDGCVFG